MRYRHHGPLLTQADSDYELRHRHEFDAHLDVSWTSNEAPTDREIENWIEFSTKCFSQNRRLIVVCTDGQFRSPTVSALIQAVYERRPFREIVEEYHTDLLLEEPSHDWWPFTEWDHAIMAYLQQHYPDLAQVTVVQETTRYPLDLIDYQFTTFRDLLRLLLKTKWQRAAYFASLYAYARSLPHPATIVEIGTYYGASAIVMGHAIRGTNSHLITIDPALREGGASVETNDGEPYTEHAINIQDIHRYIAEQKLDGYITPIPAYASEVLSRWDGRPIDMLFVDGGHTYNAVSQDCQWMEHIKPGGIAAFDDWLPGVAAAVHDYAGDHPEWEFIYESSEQAHDHYFVTQLRKKHDC